MRRFSCDFAWRHENQKRRDDAFRGLSECRANGAFSDVLREDVWQDDLDMDPSGRRVRPRLTSRYLVAILDYAIGDGARKGAEISAGL